MGKLFLRTLRSILRTRLHPVIDSKGIKGTTNDVVTDTWQILHSTTTNQHDGVFLKIVTLTSNVGDDLVAIGQAHFSDLTESLVWLLRRPGINL